MFKLIVFNFFYFFGAVLLYKFRSFFQIFFIWFLSTSNAYASEDVKVGPISDWVSLIDLPKSELDREKVSGGGLHYIIASKQIKFSDHKRELFGRFAYKITERQGLEVGGNIQIEFRPELDQLVLNRVYLHREGKVVDLLPDLKFDIIRQERGIEQGILDGRLTAYANIPKLQVGDIVEYAYTTTYQTILMADDFFTDRQFTYSGPGEVIEAKFVLPKELDVQIKYRNFDVKPTVSNNGSEKVFHWIVENPESRNTEDNSPSWYNPHSVIHLSSIKSWQEIAEHSIPHYAREDTLPESFVGAVKKIDGLEISKKEKLAKVLSLVQNDIRYVGIEIGKGAFIPRLPSTVIARGYGDCKDKSYLMVKALELLDIDAVPALAHLTEGKDLINKLPSPFAFNHVIVRAKIGDDIYWLDPTGTYQDGPDPQMAQSNYGYVLPIDIRGSGLEKIEIPAADYFQESISEAFEIDYFESEAEIKLKVVSQYKGEGADTFRRRLARNGEQRTAQSYLDYYEKNYPTIQSSVPLKVDVDDDRNSITINENYKLPRSAENVELLETLLAKDAELMSALPAIVETRKSPVALLFPYSRKSKVTFANVEKDVFTFPDHEVFENDYIRYKFYGGINEDVMTFNWEFTTKRDHVKIEELAEYFQARKKIYDTYYWTYDLRKSNPKELEEEGSNEALILYSIIGAFLAPLVLIILGYRYGLKADKDYKNEAVYFPVSTTKFVLLSIATFNLYTIFVFHKFWRWENNKTGRQVWGFVRALFFTLWIAPTISTFNRQVPSKFKFSRVHKYVLTLCMFVVVAINLGTEFYKSELIPILPKNELFFGFDQLFYIGFNLLFSVILYTLLMLPIVRRINSLPENQGALEKNSTFNIYNIIALLLFPILFATMLYGEVQ